VKTLLTLIFAIAIAAMPAVSSANEPNASPEEFCTDYGNTARFVMWLRQQDLSYTQTLDEIITATNLMPVPKLIMILVDHAYDLPLLPPMSDAEKDKHIDAFGNKITVQCLDTLKE